MMDTIQIQEERPHLPINNEESPPPPEEPETFSD